VSSRESRVRRVLEHTIDIDATPDQVWEALTGFEDYEGWNPFMRSIAGAPEVGSRLRIELDPPDGRKIVVSPSVVVADPGRELRWRGALPLGLFTGEHAYVITPAESGSRVVHRGWYRGFLVRILGSVIDRTSLGFERMHRALKQRAEELGPPVIGSLPALEGTELGIRGFAAHGSAILTEAARVVASVLGVERVGVLGLARDGQTLVLRAGVGWPAGGMGKVRATAGDGTPAGYALVHSEPLVTADVALDPRLRTLGAAETAGVVGGMAVRIQDGGRPLGVLDVWTRTPREFGESEVAFVQSVAGIVASALAVGASEARGSAAVSALLAAAEAERVRVATELHDDTLQTLTAMRLTIDRLAAAWVRGDEAAASQAVEAARNMISEAIDRTRRLAFAIVPPLLAEGGIGGALRALPEALGMQADVTADVVTTRHATSGELLCYRTVEELLRNARDHAEARHVWVEVHEHPGELAGEVTDDGVGFDVEAVLDDPARLGLLSLAQRLDSIGGRLTIQSSPGAGTRVAFEIPIR
jgi:signal transduction histidine kinase